MNAILVMIDLVLPKNVSHNYNDYSTEVPRLKKKLCQEPQKKKKELNGNISKSVARKLLKTEDFIFNHHLEDDFPFISTAYFNIEIIIFSVHFNAMKKWLK